MIDTCSRNSIPGYYRAPLMTLCILGDESPDVLERLLSFEDQC